MKLHVAVEGFSIREAFPTNTARAVAIVLVGAPDVAVVGSVGGKGLPAVPALEGLLAGVLSDVRAKDAGSRELLQRAENRRRS